MLALLALLLRTLALRRGAPLSTALASACAAAAFALAGTARARCERRGAPMVCPGLSPATAADAAPLLLLLAVAAVTALSAARPSCSCAADAQRSDAAAPLPLRRRSIILLLGATVEGVRLKKRRAQWGEEAMEACKGRV